MAASAPLRLLSPSSSPRPAQDPSPRPVRPLHAWLPRRRRQLPAVCCASLPPPPSLDLPLLPFQPAEVLIPSESKTLHLYEARYIALLEEVQKLEIGALISIRGVCRVNISNLLDMEPYFRGTVSPLMDDPSEGIEIGTKISKLRESMCNLHSLQMKLKVPEDEPLQTNIRASLLWSEKEIFEEYNESFIPGLPERLSFAAYQTVSGMSDAELLSLQKYKIQAMDSTNTLDRVNNGIEYVEHNIGMIAARLAIQNI
ncbi:uncharacterized protein LOC120685811 isoform X3 [Panicum virgatum]|uniref:uncharacterized protein LOC120685811 isoform X3 n=1 Tax=Panicum virgatum TaxID=38727 RepID=UPI0019D63B3C|nr:uncharacterized protein LOC120685811 isoform X3 [Panicum virgatum]